MGIYCYTLRKDVREVDGITIGRFQYAYKEGWGSSSSRTAKRLHAFAEKAVYANPNISYGICADSFNNAAENEIPIYELPDQCSAFLDQPRIFNRETLKTEVKVFGYLVKEGRSFKINKVYASAGHK